MNKVKIFFWILFLFSTGLFSQEILISDGGTVNTCSGTFYDSGGPSGEYGANEDFKITCGVEGKGDQYALNKNLVTKLKSYNNKLFLQKNKVF